MNDSTSVRLSEDNVVEVCAVTSGYRTGVCSNNWDGVDASVVCRQLNLGQTGGMWLFVLPIVPCASCYNYYLTQLLAPRTQVYTGFF